jgi:hypothetical protein
MRNSFIYEIIRFKWSFKNKARESVLNDHLYYNFTNYIKLSLHSSQKFMQ